MGVNKIVVKVDGSTVKTMDFNALLENLAIGAHTIVVEAYDGATLISSQTKNVTVGSLYQTETVNYMQRLEIPNDSASSIYTGKTNADLWQIVDDLIVALKGYVIWPGKIYRMYPKLGNTAAMQAQDLFSASLGTYNGSWQFTNKGSVANGSNTYFDTGFNPYANATSGKNDIGITATINSFTDGSETYPVLVGAYGGTAADLRTALYPKSGSLLSTTPYMGMSMGAVNVTTTKGIYTMTRITDTAKYLKDGVLLKTTSMGSTVQSNGNLFEGAAHWYTSTGVNAIRNYMTGTIGTTAYHKNMSDSQAAQFYTAINNFETTLGRNV